MSDIGILSTLVTVALAACAALLWVPCAFLLVEVVASVLPRRRRAQPASTFVVPPFAVLVPAHNEANSIAESLAVIRPQLRAVDRLLVVADNCDDATATIARGLGAEVSERFDLERRGKGFALDHGMRVLAQAPPSVVIVVDADCHVNAGALMLLAQRAGERGLPVQARYDMLPNADADVGQRIAAFAWRVKNLTRPRGAARLGLPCLLTGSGMAFPWAALEGAALASGNIVEDMQLGIDLARRGKAPQFCEDALVTSRFAPTSQSRQTQRRRWEHGHLATLISQVPRLAGAALALRQPRLLGLCLELCVPPLALLTALTTLLAVATMLWGSLSGAWLPALLSVTAVSSLALAIVAAWHRDGSALVSARDLLGVPLYVLRKLPIYAGFVRRRESAWIRTERPRDD